MARLVRFGFSLTEIGEWTLPQFMSILDSAEQILAHERITQTVDMATVVSAAFAGKGKNPLKEHLELLGTVAEGALGGNS